MKAKDEQMHSNKNELYKKAKFAFFGGLFKAVIKCQTEQQISNNLAPNKYQIKTKLGRQIRSKK